MALLAGGGKLPGKTTYAGRRRPMTRTSGFKVHDETTGGQFQKVLAPTYEVARDQILAISFGYPPHKPEGSFVGFGGWFRTDQPVAVQIDNGPRRRTLTTHLPPTCNKFRSIWQAQGSVTDPIRINFSAATNVRSPLHGLTGG